MGDNHTSALLFTAHHQALWSFYSQTTRTSLEISKLGYPLSPEWGPGRLHFLTRAGDSPEEANGFFFFSGASIDELSLVLHSTVLSRGQSVVID
jgi:hypothetical protein